MADNSSITNSPALVTFGGALHTSNFDTLSPDDINKIVVSEMAAGSNVADKFTIEQLRHFYVALAQNHKDFPRVDNSQNYRDALFNLSQQKLLPETHFQASKTLAQSFITDSFLIEFDKDLSMDDLNKDLPATGTKPGGGVSVLHQFINAPEQFLDGEKEKFFQYAGKKIAKHMGIRNDVELIFDGLYTEENGHIRGDDLSGNPRHTILINTNSDDFLAGNNIRVLETIGHELRHAFQKQMAKDVLKGNIAPGHPDYIAAQLFSANFSKGVYVTPIMDHHYQSSGYARQPVEIDAFHFGASFSIGLGYFKNNLDPFLPPRMFGIDVDLRHDLAVRWGLPLKDEKGKEIIKQSTPTVDNPNSPAHVDGHNEKFLPETKNISSVSLKGKIANGAVGLAGAIFAGVAEARRKDSTNGTVLDATVNSAIPGWSASKRGDTCRAFGEIVGAGASMVAMGATVTVAVPAAVAVSAASGPLSLVVAPLSGAAATAAVGVAGVATEAVVTPVMEATCNSVSKGFSYFKKTLGF